MDKHHTDITHITDEHRQVMDSLTSTNGEGFCLVSCFCNDVPSVAVCALMEGEGDDIDLHPILIFITDNMVITDHEGVATCIQ